MKLILDDNRPFPERKGYNCVRTYEDCVFLLSVFKKLSFISLDYNLGEEKTGLDVLVYMFENKIEAEHINIHSDHERGKPKMIKYAMEHFPEAKVTTSPLKA